MEIDTGFGVSFSFSSDEYGNVNEKIRNIYLKEEKNE